MSIGHEDEDRVDEEITQVFLQAGQLFRERRPNCRGPSPSMEMDAMGLLLDYALLLGPSGLADVMEMLIDERIGTRPATREQIASVVSFVLEDEERAPL